MKLPEKLREQLKVPLGRLILEKDATRENILSIIPKNSFVITVGDRTTEKLIEFGVVPSLQIIDGQEKRVKRKILDSLQDMVQLSCSNPAAEITRDSIQIIKKALSSKPPVRITVIGEEDLLVIPVCIHAPESSLVLYGQPNEGLVIVPITNEIRNKAQSFLDLMTGE